MRAFAGTGGKGRASRALLAALVALALTLGTGMPGASAWAANLNNPDVPTDDTGVVTPAEDQDAGEDEAAGDQGDAATETEAPADADQDASTAGGRRRKRLPRPRAWWPIRSSAPSAIRTIW